MTVLEILFLKTKVAKYMPLLGYQITNLVLDSTYNSSTYENSKIITPKNKNISRKLNCSQYLNVVLFGTTSSILL